MNWQATPPPRHALSPGPASATPPRR